MFWTCRPSLDCQPEIMLFWIPFFGVVAMKMMYGIYFLMFFDRSHKSKKKKKSLINIKAQKKKTLIEALQMKFGFSFAEVWMPNRSCWNFGIIYGTIRELQQFQHPNTEQKLMNLMLSTALTLIKLSIYVTLKEILWFYIFLIT